MTGCYDHSFFHDLLLVLIIVGYFVIVWQIYDSAREFSKVARQKAYPFFYMMGIFSFCAISGYATKLFNMPHSVSVWFHAFLVSFTWLFIFSRQANQIIKRILE